MLDGGADHQAPLQLRLRRATGVTVAFHLSLLVVGVMHGVDMSWDPSAIIAYSVESPCINLSLVSKL